MRKNFFLLLMVAMFLGACTSYKQVPYLQNSEQLKGVEASQALYDARIMPKDLLTITVNSDDIAAAAPFNLTVQTTATANLTTRSMGMTTQPALMSYLVDNNGNIEFPSIGTVHYPGFVGSVSFGRNDAWDDAFVQSLQENADFSGKLTEMKTALTALADRATVIADTQKCYTPNTGKALDATEISVVTDVTAEELYTFRSKVL